jgi:nucleotide-binding universal stress UspA family protein
MKKADIKTILVPIDFSRLSAPAIQVAKDLARRFGASIHLVHVHEFFYPMDLLVPVPMSVATFRDDAATRRVRRLKILAKRNGLAVENCHFMTGVPTFHEICSLARQIAADLIVMPTHGYTGLAHLLGGSTAERIVQHSPCPVLVARGNGRKTSRVASDGGALRSIDTILVPVDFSEASFQAIEYAIEFAERVAARLIVFHAVNLAESFTANGYGMYDVDALEEAARRDAESQMQKFIALAKFHRVQFETVVRVAPAVSEISALAQERDVDLIITATHGRTGLKHLLMGSIAEHVVRHAPRPVLVVPSHPELRAARLTKKSPGAPRPRRLRSEGGLLPDLGETLTKKNRKLLAHPAPERRQINRFRESHAL